MGARLQMSSDWGRPVEAVLAKLLNNGWSQEAAAAAADRLAATSPATTELEPERPAVPISEIPCTGFWLNEGELARWNRINTQLCWKWANEDRAWYLSLTGRDIPQHLHVPKPHAPHECHLHAPEPQHCDDSAQPLILATRPPPDARHQAPATQRHWRSRKSRRERHEVYWLEVRVGELRKKPCSQWTREERDWFKSAAAMQEDAVAKAWMNEYESENEGEEPPAQEAAEEEAKEPPSPSQSSRDDQWKPMDAVTAWCQRERAVITRLHHRI